MFILRDAPLSPDVAFTDINDIQRPANWLRLATPEEREAAGISEVADPPVYDQRFYWGYAEDGTLLPKDHATLVKQWVGQTKATAGSLLAPSDWYITRMAETGTGVKQEVLDRRQQIRDFSNLKEAAIEATSSTDELAAYVTSSDYSRWEPMELERARNADGTYKGDDPSTPDVNEAYVTSGF